ncbi:MAG: histidine kinase [Pelobium sp.]
MRFRIIIIIYLLLESLSLSAQTINKGIVSLSSLKGVNYIFDSPEIQLASSSKESTIKQAIKLSYSVNKRSIRSNDKKAYWFKFIAHNNLAVPASYYIYCANNDNAEIYIFQNNRLINKGKAGIHTPTPELQIKNTPFYLEFKSSPSITYVLYLKVYNDKNIKPNLNLTIEDRSTYNEEILKHRKTILNENFLIVFFLGSAIIIFLFMVFLYFKSYQKLYLYYAIYILGAIVYALTRLNRITLVGSLIDYYPFLRPYLNEPIQFIFFAVYNFFVLELLDIKKHDKKLVTWIKALAYIYIAYAVYHFLMMYFTFNHQLRNQLFVITRLILFPLNTIMAIWIYRKVKSPIINYFLFGLGIYLTSGLIAFVVDTNYRYLSNYNSLLASSNIFQAGILIEILCFSLAIGYRIKLNEDEKNLSKDKLLEQLQINQKLIQTANQELEKKVILRTNEIIKINKENEARKLATIKLEFEKKIAEAETQALRSQMNPHFLFNSLNSIRYLVMNNENEKAVIYLSKFSKLIRLILENSRYEVISLDQELAALQLYIGIEANRFGEQFQYQLTTDPNVDLEFIKIPPLLLQPFVENAIWHGLMPSKKPIKSINILIEKDIDKENIIKLTIEDNGIGRLASAKAKNNFSKKSSLGMVLTQERINLFNISKNNIHLEVFDKVDEEALSGTKIIFTFNIS